MRPSTEVELPVDVEARPVIGALRMLFVAASVLVLVATVQLFVLSARTDRFFAWTIAVPLTAAIDGSFYLAALLPLVAAAWARTWSDARPLAWAVMTVSTVKLVATLLHLSPFHFGDPDLAPRVAAWGWLVVYVTVPIALAGLIAAQVRLPGRDPLGVAPMPRALRWVSGAVAGVLLAAGVLLLLAPGTTAARWPWSLSPLTAQALCAWFVGIGVLVALHVRDGDLVRARFLWMTAVALSVLQGIALARYSHAFHWRSVAGVAYLAFMGTIGAVGAWGWIVRLAWSRRSEHATRALGVRSAR